MVHKTIRIIIESYNHSILVISANKMKEALINNQYVLEFVGPISLPTKKKSYCVLKSPHVNKDSREQFELRKYKKVIDITTNSSEVIKTLIEVDFLPGVSTSIFSTIKH
uniref:Ribosomal protein S10 n=1 Tax=Phaeophyceae sp. TaxID=2249243 RepID=A0A8E5BHV6_9PHAE|nr:ribosomal protein S10 [Phaeophyceae sp.]